MKKIALIIFVLVISINQLFACFDTYLFLRKSSMVYPIKYLVLETNGEYSFTKFSSPSEDMFFIFGNLYYGVFNRFSMQISLGSGEKPRGEFKLDSYGIRGVYNIYTNPVSYFTVDLILEHRGMLTEKSNEIEVSTPAIFYGNDFTYVIHPTFNYAFNKDDFTLGGHLGLFYNLSSSSLVGIGVEYFSVHSSSYAGQRLTESEASTSLFFGTYLGERIYLQNEIAKGLSNSRDLGFALTTKFVLN